LLGKDRRHTLRCPRHRRPGPYPLVIADPPYIPTAEVHRFPDDPTSAIDGGRDGRDLVRACLGLFAGVLAPGGRALLQLGTLDGVDQATERHAEALRLVARRSIADDRHVVLFERARSEHVR
jgi:release factor glutamine methyltransferase